MIYSTHRAPLQVSRSWRWCAAVLQVCWSALMVAVTFTPSLSSPGRMYRVVARIARWLTDGQWVPDFMFVEAVGNVLMFVPYGALWVLVLGRPANLWRCGLATLISAATSASIELVQWQFLPLRVADPRDIVHNTLGGAIGACAVTAVGLCVFAVRRRRA